MRPITRLVQFELGAARDDLFAELDESVDDVAQVEQFGLSAANGEHIGREARLSGRVPPKLVEHHVRSGVALQVDDNAHAQPIEIGRASCRERGCQYGYVSVVPVSLKQKTKHT